MSKFEKQIAISKRHSLFLKSDNKSDEEESSEKSSNSQSSSPAKNHVRENHVKEKHVKDPASKVYFNLISEDIDLQSSSFIIHKNLLMKLVQLLKKENEWLVEKNEFYNTYIFQKGADRVIKRYKQEKEEESGEKLDWNDSKNWKELWDHTTS